MNWNREENKRLIEAVLSLKSRDEAKRFLRDLLTEGEITEMGKRLQAAEMLSKGVPYSTIERETGFSSTTVARVAKWLNTGEGGYRMVFNKSHHDSSIQMRRGLS
jgi:TrpR-related protein YerC/YecD